MLKTITVFKCKLIPGVGILFVFLYAFLYDIPTCATFLNKDKPIVFEYNTAEIGDGVVVDIYEKTGGTM